MRVRDARACRCVPQPLRPAPHRRGCVRLPVLARPASPTALLPSPPKKTHPLSHSLTHSLLTHSPTHPLRYNPIKTIKTSFMGTMNMLGLARRVRARFLLTSTSEVRQRRPRASRAIAPAAPRCAGRAARRRPRGSPPAADGVRCPQPAGRLDLSAPRLEPPQPMSRAPLRCTVTPWSTPRRRPTGGTSTPSASAPATTRVRRRGGDHTQGAVAAAAARLGARGARAHAFGASSRALALLWALRADAGSRVRAAASSHLPPGCCTCSHRWACVRTPPRQARGRVPHDGLPPRARHRG